MAFASMGSEWLSVLPTADLVALRASLTKTSFFTDEEGIVHPIRDSEGYEEYGGRDTAPSGPVKVDEGMWRQPDGTLTRWRDLAHCRESWAKEVKGTKLYLGKLDRLKPVETMAAMARMQDLLQQFPQVPVDYVRVGELRSGGLPSDKLVIGQCQGMFNGASHIDFSEEWFGKAREDLNLYQSSRGFHPVGTDNPAGYATHEFGHAVQNYLDYRLQDTGPVGLRTSETYGNFWVGMSHQEYGGASTFSPADARIEGRSVSGYAGKNDREAFAEVFSGAYSGLEMVQQMDISVGMRGMLAAVGLDTRPATKVTKGEWDESAHPRDERGRFEGGPLTAEEFNARMAMSAAAPGSPDYAASAGYFRLANRVVEGSDGKEGVPPRAEYLKAAVAADVGWRLEGRFTGSEILESPLGRDALAFAKAQGREDTSPGTMVADFMHERWADSSGDHNEMALMYQRAVAEEFGLKDVADPARVYGSQAPSDQKYDQYSEMLRGYARAEYEQTQAKLAEAGITELTLFRGMENRTGGPGFTADTFRDGLTSNPASSWTVNAKTAGSFASPGGAIVAETIPAERMLSTAFSGAGCLNEKEVVVLGGTDQNISAFQWHDEPKRMISEWVSLKAAKAGGAPFNIDGTIPDADWPKRTDDHRAAHEAKSRSFKWDEAAHPRDENGRFASGDPDPPDYAASRRSGTDEDVRAIAYLWSGGGMYGQSGSTDIRYALSHGLGSTSIGVSQDAAVLARAVADSKPTGYELYRGIHLTEDVYPQVRESLAPGKSVDMNLCSWSKDQSVAYSFARGAWGDADPQDHEVIFKLDPGAKAYNATYDIQQGPSFTEHISGGRYDVSEVFHDTNPDNPKQTIDVITLRQTAVFTQPEQYVGTKAAVSDVPWSQARFLPWLEEATDRVQQHRVTKSYNPDQPRDERGRWSSAGGGDLAYHSGDLQYGRDTALGRMTPGRNTGHFGTGVYFASSPANITGRADRPTQSVDLSRFNMFKPADAGAGMQLHDGLRLVNEAVHERADVAHAAERLAPVLGVPAGELAPRIGAAVAGAQAEFGRAYWATPTPYVESASTRLMRDLGYDGVDVRHLPGMDNTQYGTVVYRQDLSGVRKYSEDEPRDEGGRWTSGAAGQALESTLQTGGATVSLSGGVPTTGYIVAFSGHSGTFPESVLDDRGAFTDAMEKWYTAERAVFEEHPDFMVGVWHADPTSPMAGSVVFDPVEHFEDREKAIAAGVSRNEFSIWDVANQQEISTGGTGQGPEPAQSKAAGGGQAAEAARRDDGRGAQGVLRAGVRPSEVVKYSEDEARDAVLRKWDESQHPRGEGGRFADGGGGSPTVTIVPASAFYGGEAEHFPPQPDARNLTDFEIEQTAKTINERMGSFFALGGSVKVDVSAAEKHDASMNIREMKNAGVFGPTERGPMFADFGLDEGKANVAYTVGGDVAGAHGFNLYPEEYTHFYGSDEVLGHGIFGSTGIQEGTGSALTAAYIKQAADAGIGVAIQPIPTAESFWRQMGMREDETTGSWGMSAADCKLLADKLDGKLVAGALRWP